MKRGLDTLERNRYIPADALHKWRFQPRRGAICDVLFTLAHAIFAVTRLMRKDDALPSPARKHVANRIDFYAGKILLLVRRLAPGRCGELFMRNRGKPGLPVHLMAANRKPKQKPKPKPKPKPKSDDDDQEPEPELPPISAREAAKRFAHFSASIEALAAQIGQPIPSHIRELIDNAREALGCDALNRNPVKNIAYWREQLRDTPRAGQRRARPRKPRPTPPSYKPGDIVHPLLPPIPHKRE